MNKFEKALNKIMDDTCHMEELGEPIQVVKELVVKETPVKHEEGYCGKCERAIPIYDINMEAALPDYCGHCGYRVDLVEE